MQNDEKWYIHYCWNGSKRQVECTDTFDTKKEWEWFIEGLPYDFLDGDDHNVWADYGDNDDWEG